LERGAERAVLSFRGELHDDLDFGRIGHDSRERQGMTTRTTGGTRRIAAFAFLATLCASGAVLAQDRARAAFAGHDGPAHEHFDARFSHNHYYFDRGYRVDEPPRSGYPIEHDRTHYWYDRGHWYLRDDLGWLVVGAPVGAFLSALPPDYTTVWFGGVSYYYANDAYYAWNGDQRAYEVVQPPAGIDSAGATQAPGSAGIFAYALNGQSSKQQARDREECHRSGVEQAGGYDPTQAGGDGRPEGASSKRDDYFRAEAACLDARGYSIW
jgi:hypothetical protein